MEHGKHDSDKSPVVLRLSFEQFHLEAVFSITSAEHEDCYCKNRAYRRLNGICINGAWIRTIPLLICLRLIGDDAQVIIFPTHVVQHDHGHTDGSRHQIPL